MSIAFATPGNEVKTNQPVNVTICITNISNSVLYLLDISVREDFSFVITSPLYNDASPKRPSGTRISSRTVQRYIQPNGSINYVFDLRSVCNFNEIGTYEVTAKRKVAAGYEIISNALKVTVVPGVWKSETTNAPPIGF